MIDFTRPRLGKEELDAVADVFDSGWVGYGPRSGAFEAEFAEHLGVPPEQVLFLNSATAGTFLAFELLGLGEGDEVVMPAISFNSGPNATLSCGARPVFCEVDPWTLNPAAADVEQAITPRTKAVLVLHYGGHPGHIEEIAELCARRGLALVEDASCAVASRAAGRAAGTFGDMAVWSFDTMKTLVTGDGGMLRVRDPELARRARRLSYHGLAQPADGFTPPPWKTWAFEQREIARRLLGNDLTAAIGSVQLRRLPEFVARRKELAARYDERLRDLDGVRLPPPVPAGHESSHYLYWVKVHRDVRDDVARRLHEAGIPASYRYGPLHRVEVYGVDCRLPKSDAAADETLCLPLHQGLDDQDVDRVASCLRDIIGS